MGKVKYLIDTSAVIKYLNNTFERKATERLDKILDIESVISFITEIELLAWNPPEPKDLEVYQSFVDQSVIMNVNKGSNSKND